MQTRAIKKNLTVRCGGKRKEEAEVEAKEETEEEKKTRLRIGR